MKKTVAVLPGDGIGPEVMAEAIRILEHVAKKWGHIFVFQQGLVGGAAFDVHGEHFPKQTLELCRNSDAILFGSVGGPVAEQHLPKWKGCEASSILAIRKAFQFHANFRPATVYPQLLEICPLKRELVEQGIDILFVRELLGDIYFGEHKTETVQGIRTAFDVAMYSESQISAVAHTAFQAARRRGKRLTSVDKANVLDTSKLWRTVVTEIAAEYSDVQLEHMLVDNCAMQLIRNPAQFDVILTSNMFGDILSDEGAVLPGSLGLMPSASLNSEGFGLYEPSGGSAPDIAGKGIANPIAQNLSAALMLRHSFSLVEEANAIEAAVTKALDEGARTSDIAGTSGKRKISSTSEMTSVIMKHI